MPQSDWEALRNAKPHGEHGGICEHTYTGDRYDWFKTTSVEISGSAFPKDGAHSFESVKFAAKKHTADF